MSSWWRRTWRKPRKAVRCEDACSEALKVGIENKHSNDTPLYAMLGVSILGYRHFVDHARHEHQSLQYRKAEELNANSNRLVNSPTQGLVDGFLGS